MSRTALLTKTFTLQSHATANGNGTVAAADGYAGPLNLLIANGAGTCTVTVQGSFDNFATTQNILTVGVTKLADSGAGVNTSRTLASGALAVAANTSYLYQLADLYPYLRAVLSSASGLGAGTNLTGCTVLLYAVP